MVEFILPVFSSLEVRSLIQDTLQGFL